MDDLKLFSKIEDQIGMQFGIKKCDILTIKRGKVVRYEGRKLPNDEVMKEVEKERYKYHGIVELDKVKENEMKKRTTEEHKQRLRQAPKIKTKWEKQNNSNKYMGSGCIQIRSRNTTVERV